MMRRAILLSALILTGCPLPLPRGAERPPRAPDILVVDAVIDAWRSAGEPYPTTCVEERASRMVVIRADQETMTSTGYCASRGPCCGSVERQEACGCDWAHGGIGCAAGATTWEGDIIDPFAALTDTYRVQIWISAYEDEQTQRRVLAHEAVHWLGRCATNDPDPQHQHVERWGSSGYEAAGR